MTDAANENTNWLEDRRAFLRQTGFEIETLADPHLTMEGGTLARIRLRGESFELFISDEYRDLDLAIPELSAEVVLRACLEYLDHTNSEAWCRAESIPARCRLPLKLHWNDYRQAAGNILIRLKPLEDQVSDLDWQLNSGRAQELRGL